MKQLLHKQKATKNLKKVWNPKPACPTYAHEPQDHTTVNFSVFAGP